MSKKIAVTVWFLGLALANLPLFVLERGMTPTFWITLAFVWAAFLSALVFQIYLTKQSQTPKDGFLHIPAFMVSLIYAIVQIPISIIFALGSAAIPAKAALLVQGVLLIAAWAVALLSLGGNDHIQKVNSRQKNHHTSEGEEVTHK